jgi:PKD repeat protein
MLQRNGGMMKLSKLIVGVIIVIIFLILLFNFYLFPNLQDKELKEPQAKIDIKKVVSGDLIINQGEYIYFSAENSSDEDGKIDNYHWDFDDGNTSNSIDPIHKYDHPGIYNVTLTVTDNDGNKDVTSITITVLNSKPVAKINIENHPLSDSGKIPIFYSIQFNSTGTYDSDGNITYWYWDFGDGNYSSDENPLHRYDNIGIFIITLTIHDDDGEKAEDYIEIEIILRTYEVDWEIEQTEKIIRSNGYTLEGNSTELLDQIDQEQISSIEIILNWTDRQPFLKNNQTPGEDLFELNILTPEKLSYIENSSSGQIIIPIEYISGISDSSYNAKTANEAINYALIDAGFIDGGVGEWYYNVTALECKGGSWANENFDLDVGNFWDLEIIIYYYTFEINDISY